jgi:hypothetical protein
VREHAQVRLEYHVFVYEINTHFSLTFQGATLIIISSPIAHIVHNKMKQEFTTVYYLGKSSISRIMACKIMLHLQINYYLRVATIVATMGVLDKKENSSGIVSDYECNN